MGTTYWLSAIWHGFSSLFVSMYVLALRYNHRILYYLAHISGKLTDKTASRSISNGLVVQLSGTRDGQTLHLGESRGAVKSEHSRVLVAWQGSSGSERARASLRVVLRGVGSSRVIFSKKHLVCGDFGCLPRITKVRLV